MQPPGKPVVLLQAQSARRTSKTMTSVPSSFNMAAYVLGQARQHPDKTALVLAGKDENAAWSYGDLHKRVAGIAGGLRAQGVQPGHRILMRLENSVAFPLTYLASIWAGILPIPTSSALTAAEITRIAERTNPDLIVASPGIALPDQIDCPVLTDHALLALADHAPLPPQMGDPNRPAYIIFTSGTASAPKGIVHAHRAVWARRMMWTDWYDLTPSDRLLHAGAFNWTYTLGTGLMDPWAIGATAIVPKPGTPASDLPLLLAQEEATLFAAAPGVYRQILSQCQTLGLPHLRHALSAGEALPETIRARWRDAGGGEIYQALGMSECSTFISENPKSGANMGRMGYPQTGRRIACLDQDHAPTAIDAPGSLAVHASDPGLMLEYLDDPQATQEAFAQDWFLTGDSVSIAADGAVTFLGRQDDLLNAGGYRVSPMEVEAAVTEHPDITEAAAVTFEVKSETFVIAVAYVAPHKVSDTELSTHCAQRLAAYKCPRLFRHLPTLPKSGNGKLNRKILRESAYFKPST